MNSLNENNTNSTQNFSGNNEIELVALAIKARGVRCKTLTDGEPITLKPKRQILYEVPGQILKVRPNKLWKHARTKYLSGELASARIDVGELNLVPLGLAPHGQWHPKDEYLGEPGENVDEFFLKIIQAGPRPMFEMEQVIPGEDPEDAWSDPIIEASELHEAGARDEAMKIMEKILVEDLRCLDAHAHMGNWRFNSGLDELLQQARLHYEVGVRIGELSLPPNFDGVLLWGMIDNRPFLRCLHGLGLCHWRMGEIELAKQVFERMLWLNPRDNQGIRFLLADIRDGSPWKMDQD